MCAERWIPVAESMPDADELVLTFIPGEDVFPGFFDGEVWCGLENVALFGVTHWMHMPEGPERWKYV